MTLRLLMWKFLILFHIQLLPDNLWITRHNTSTNNTFLKINLRTYLIIHIFIVYIQKALKITTTTTKDWRRLCLVLKFNINKDITNLAVSSKSWLYNKIVFSLSNFIMEQHHVFLFQQHATLTVDVPIPVSNLCKYDINWL
jgi:hypothetical protein